MSHKSRIILHLALAFAGAVIVKLGWEYVQGKWSWWPHWNSADVLAAFAIAFAIVQFLDARQAEQALSQQESKLNQQEGRLIGITDQIQVQAGEMNSIALSMSTRFAGHFPDNLKEIIDLVSKVDRHLRIIVDFPGYGQYSSPELYLEYKHKIELARTRDVEVQIICYDERLASEDRLEQFPDDPDRFQSRDMRRFEQFFRHRKIKPHTDFAGLRQLLKDHDEEMIRHLQGQGVMWKFHSERAAFFLWLRDDADAVFTFKNVGRKDVGLSFRTQDANLVRQFSDIFHRRWEKASDQYQLIQSTKVAD